MIQYQPEFAQGLKSLLQIWVKNHPQTILISF